MNTTFTTFTIEPHHGMDEYVSFCVETVNIPPPTALTLLSNSNRIH